MSNIFNNICGNVNEKIIPLKPVAQPKIKSLVRTRITLVYYKNGVKEEILNASVECAGNIFKIIMYAKDSIPIKYLFIPATNVEKITTEWRESYES